MPFVSQTITIACPLGTMREVFSEDDTAWLVPFVRLAILEGRSEADRLYARFGAHPRERDLRRPDATVTLGERSVRVEPPAFTAEISWTAIGYGAGLATFEGRLTGVPLCAGETMLTVEGRFEQAADVDFNGRLADRRAAETAVKSFLRLLRTAVEEAEHRVS